MLHEWILLHSVTGPLDFITLPVMNTTFTPVSTYHVVSVVIVDDDILEEGKYFVVEFSVDEEEERVDVSGPDNATVTIVDNDSEHCVVQLSILFQVHHHFLSLLQGVQSGFRQCPTRWWKVVR